MAVEVYVMRHGETEANLRQILIGREDSPFTEAGWRQPVEVARYLVERPVSRIYSSPMDRTLRTAALVQQTLDRSVPVDTEPAIAEIDAGEFTGLTFQEVRSRLPSDAALGKFHYPGGESWRDVQERSVAFVYGLEARHNSDAVLVVTHAGVIAGLVAEYLQIPIEEYIRTRFGHDFLGRITVAAGMMTGYEKIAGTVDSWI
ncbi:MAG: histidine phosphatase family protein [Gemmatimonadota bacterium]|nr:MAG: histidine phosphatase family protein [Gemmatimonadota bacterium]